MTNLFQKHFEKHKDLESVIARKSKHCKASTSKQEPQSKRMRHSNIVFGISSFDTKISEKLFQKQIMIGAVSV